MAAEQRRRILEATGELVGEHGYLGFKVAELLSRAEVSLATVRKHFGGKEGCYLALLDLSFEEARRRLDGVATRSRDSGASGIAAAISALFNLAAMNPRVARVCLVEPFAAGAEAIERYEAALAELGLLLRERLGREGLSGWPAEGMESGLGATVLWWPTLYLTEGEGEQIGELAASAAELIRAAGVERGIPPKGDGTRASNEQAKAAGWLGGRGGANGVEHSAERVLGPLPAGRHGLPREAVEESQWERLVAGLVSAVVKKGYAEATLTDITGEAQVSRRVFYENFGSKEQCFLAAWDTVAAHVGAVAMEGAAQRAGEPGDEAVGALGAVLEFFATEPETARFCMVEGLAAGRLARQRYSDAVSRFAADLRERLGPPFDGLWASASGEALVGAVATMLSLRIARDGAAGLPAMLPGLAEFLLAPYVGHAEADRIARETEAQEAGP